MAVELLSIGEPAYTGVLRGVRHEQGTVESLNERPWDLVSIDLPADKLWSVMKRVFDTRQWKSGKCNILLHPPRMLDVLDPALEIPMGGRANMHRLHIAAPTVYQKHLVDSVTNQSLHAQRITRVHVTGPTFGHIDREIVLLFNAYAAFAQVYQAVDPWFSHLDVVSGEPRCLTLASEANNVRCLLTVSDSPRQTLTFVGAKGHLFTKSIGAREVATMIRSIAAGKARMTAPHLSEWCHILLTAFAPNQPERNLNET